MRFGRWRALGAAILVALLAATALLATGGGCGGSGHGPKVLVIGIDGADWQIMGPLIESGKLPHLKALMDRGVSAPLQSLYPIISPVIWTTIATGKGPDQHGILDFTMPDPNTGSPIIVSSSLRRSKAFWNILTELGHRVCVVGWWASWPAEPVQGINVSDRITYHAFIETPDAETGLVYPPEKADEILDLRINPADVAYETTNRFIDVSPEEFRAAPLDDFRNPISHLRHIYRTMASYAAIARRLMEKERPDVMAVYFEGVDTSGHMYMRYTPPEYPYTTAEERRKYGRAVEEIYRYQDEIVGDLVSAAGEDATIMIVSDHGFLSGRERPIEETADLNYATASRWHRLFGVMILAGPQIRPLGNKPTDSPIKQATVFDVMPTLLVLAGVAPAADMEGQVLTEAFAEGVTVPPTVASYEDEAWREDRASARAALVSGADNAMKERLRSLGYIGSSEYEETLSLRAQWSLAEYYMFRRELEKAENELLAVAERAPDLPESYYLLGVIYSQRHEFERAREMLERCLALSPDKLEAQFELATLYRGAGRLDEAVMILERAVARHPSDPQLLVNLGILYRERGRAREALGYYDKAIQLDTGFHPAYAQSAIAYETLNQPAEAARCWATAVRLRPDDRTAQAHLQKLRERGYGQEN